MSEIETTTEVDDDAVPDMAIPVVTPEWLTQDILLMPGLLPWGDYLIEVADQVPRWIPKREDAGYPGPKEIRVELSYAACLAHAEQGLIKIICKSLDIYKKSNVFAEVFSDSGYHLLKYEEGECYDAHCDQLGGRETGPPKYLTVMMYPNDDYEGGEVYFPRHDISVKPTAGDVFVFPSGLAFPHGCKPVTKGTRYCVVSWLS